jgi:class 3 adenylate cyclase
VGTEAAVSVNWGGWHGWGKPPLGDRILTTMLMTDIAGSTGLAAEIGDAAWGHLLSAHNSRVREVFERYRGQEIASTGDGFVAVFDGAERAVRCAADISNATAGLGLQIRAAVHTGEVEFVPGNIRGLAVHETARILALADAGEILASSTTRELVSAAGFKFEDRGRHKLKGIPGERNLYAVRADAR